MEQSTSTPNPELPPGTREASAEEMFEEVTKAAEKLGDGYYALLLVVENGRGVWRIWDVRGLVSE